MKPRAVAVSAIAAGAVIVFAISVVNTETPSTVPLTVAQSQPPTPAPTTPSPSPEASTPTDVLAAGPQPVEAEVFRNGPRDTNLIALTFDADMSEYAAKQMEEGNYPAQYNEEVIDILQANNVPATIFVTGMWVERYPEAMQRLAENPLWEIGNHGYDHRAFTSTCYGLDDLDAAEKPDQVFVTAGLIAQYTGSFPQFFRFPGLCHSSSDVELAARAGSYTVDTDLSVSDAFAENARTVTRGILNQVEPGSVILLHLNGEPNAPTTAEVVADIVPALRNEGYEFAPLDQVLGLRPQLVGATGDVQLPDLGLPR